jgi:tetratricopeptide (TPR) repeat protein
VQKKAQYEKSDPDTLHNLVMDAARLRREDLELALLKAGIELFPKNVDLRADLLQLLHMKMYDPEGASDCWKELNNDDVVPKKERELNWRYWVFGAIYHAKALSDIPTAKKLMENGLDAVPERNKSDVLRSYEDIFIDLSPEPDTGFVRDALIDGIKKGYVLGYTLAIKLATLSQQQAELDANMKGRSPALDEALAWLTLAEARFTNDGNHPVTDIYRTRINVLMALCNYNEAIDYVAAYHAQAPEAAWTEGSLKAQLVLACQRSGKPELAEKIMPKEDRPRNMMTMAASKPGVPSVGGQECGDADAQYTDE